MKKVLWVTYGVILLLLALLGVIGAFYSNAVVMIATLVSTAFTLLYLTALYGYVFKKTFWNPRAWRVLFWINIFLLGLNTLIRLVFLSTPEAMGEWTVNLLFGAPLLYVLFKYSSEENAVWGESHYKKQARLLAEVLKNCDTATATVFSKNGNGELRLDVSIQREAGEVVVKMKKSVASEVQDFRNTFISLEDAAKFLADNTPVRAGDFA